MLSFTWPSAAYTLDILAWDWFYALSILFAAPVFKVGRLEKTLRLLMIVSGVLSLAGLIGVPLANMQVRNIGVVGYALVAPVIFLLLGILFGRTRAVPEDTKPMRLGRVTQ
jgi:cytochrome c oxidase subunit IV